MDIRNTSCTDISHKPPTCKPEGDDQVHPEVPQTPGKHGGKGRWANTTEEQKREHGRHMRRAGAVKTVAREWELLAPEQQATISAIVDAANELNDEALARVRAALGLTARSR